MDEVKHIKKIRDELIKCGLFNLGDNLTYTKGMVVIIPFDILQKFDMVIDGEKVTIYKAKV